MLPGETELLIKSPTSTLRLKEDADPSYLSAKPASGASPMSLTTKCKSNEQDRTVSAKDLGKKIESIDETPEITEEGECGEKEEKAEEEMKTKTKLELGAKQNLKHFTFADQDMEFKPPKKTCNKGGKNGQNIKLG